MRAGFEGYARLLRRIGETRHQSCLLLTSREKPADLVPLEGSRSPVRILRLAGLDGRTGAQLLTEKDVVGSPHDRERLVEVYRGNPLALKIVAQTISELFGGEIAPFLEQSEVVFGGVRELLDEQFERLSVLDRRVCASIRSKRVGAGTASDALRLALGWTTGDVGSRDTLSPCSQVLRHIGLSVFILSRFRGMLVSPSPFGSRSAP
jgi:hypothetical protein